MTLWITVLASCALAYALKLAGYLVPPSLVDGPRRSSIISLLPVALLTALVVVQAFGGSGGALVVDARVAGVAVALVLLALGRGFITVVVAAAIVTAGLRALGWG